MILYPVGKDCGYISAQPNDPRYFLIHMWDDQEFVFSGSDLPVLDNYARSGKWYSEPIPVYCRLTKVQCGTIEPARNPEGMPRFSLIIDDIEHTFYTHRLRSWVTEEFRGAVLVFSLTNQGEAGQKQLIEVL